MDVGGAKPFEKVKLTVRESASRFSKEFLKFYLQRKIMIVNLLDGKNCIEKRSVYDETSDQLKG
ncbi:MAG: hypothetical protein LBS15_00180 [Endomicrobium sp.]|jgi:hypothetical protein|nr:hypothetical protein [Endomicrobium sp.]